MKHTRYGFVLGLLVPCALVSAAAGAEQLFQDLNSQRFSAMRVEAFRDIQLLPKVQALLGRPGQELKLRRAEAGSGIKSHLFQHFYHGLEVVGSMVGHHIGPNGKQVSGLVPQFDLDVSPAISAIEAASIARSRVGDRELGDMPVLKVLPMKGNLTAARLVYWIKLKQKDDLPGRDLIIDAHTGKVVADISHRISLTQIAPVDVYQTNKKCQTLSMFPDELGGYAPQYLDHKKCDLVIQDGKDVKTPDEVARQSLSNSQKVLNYYMTVHGRNSFDDKGTRSVSVVHIGKKWTNAFWDSENEIMAYGDGDGKIYKELVYSVDVAGHEMTHGVVSKTADLVYMGESGALNEAYADLFGEAIEGESDWVMGARLFTDPAQAVNGLRNLKDPHALKFAWPDENGKDVERPYPATVKEMLTFKPEEGCDGNNDYCGVHLNSTVMGHWGYLVSQAIGAEKAQKLWYATLTQYLAARDDFKTAADKTKKACTILYDADTCTKVGESFAQVGL